VEADLTYNFDPERWFAMRRRLLLARRDSGDLDDAELAAGIERLERELEAMQDRLDGTYQVGPLAPGTGH
jgi:hypothetical protein